MHVGTQYLASAANHRLSGRYLQTADQYRSIHWWKHNKTQADLTRSSAIAERLRDALVNIEKKLAIDLDIYTKVITVAAIKWPYGISLPVCGLFFQRLYLGPF